MQFQEFRTGAEISNEHGLHLGQMTPGLAEDPTSRKVGTMPQTMPNSIRSGELTSQSQGISAYNCKEGHLTERGVEPLLRRRETFGPVLANTAQRQLHQLLQTPGTHSNQQKAQSPHLIGGTQSLLHNATHHSNQLINALTLQNLQNMSMTFGEKQRLFEHIQLLEQVQSEVQESLNKLMTENRILSRFRYAHVGSKVEKILPLCFEDEVFTQWTKFLHLVTRCLKKCFHDGDLFKPGYLGHTKPTAEIDTELLIKFIERKVQVLQSIEKQVTQRKHQPAGAPRMREAHLQVIEIISESSMKLAQLPELNSSVDDRGHGDDGAQVARYQEVYATISEWKHMI